MQPMRGPSMQRSQTSNTNAMTMYASGSIDPSQPSSNYNMVPVPVSTNVCSKSSDLSVMILI